MAQGFGSFDATYYGPTYTEDIEAIERGIQQGLQIGTNIRQQRMANEKQKADLEAQRKIDAAKQLALDKQDDYVREGLIIPPESKSDNLNDATIDFSNMLVDKLNQLKIARDDGAITAADYSKGVLVLQAQIPAYKASTKVMFAQAETLMDAINDGTLSNANNPQTIEFWSAITRGDADVTYKVNDDGSMSLVGTWKDSDGKEEKIDVALGEMDRLPTISLKPETTVKDQLAADVKNILDTKDGNAMRKLDPKTGQYKEEIQELTNPDGSYQTWLKQFATESFDGYFNGLGRGDKRQALKEYLMDSVDIADRKVLMDKLAGGDGAESYGIARLDELLEGKNSTDINDFINTFVKVNWFDKTKEAVIEANREIINKSNKNTYEARLKLQKDEANTRKAIYQAEETKLGLEKTKNSSKPKDNSSELASLYAEITARPTILNPSQTQRPINLTEIYGPAFKKRNIFIDQDEETGDYLIGFAGMKDQNKKRRVDPKRIGDIDFVMQEIAALKGETWNKPIIIK